MRIAGAMNEVATLKEVVSKAESNAAAKHLEREKQEARVAEVRQELQALMKKHESLSLTQSRERPSSRRVLKNAKSAKAES